MGYTQQGVCGEIWLGWVPCSLLPIHNQIPGHKHNHFAVGKSGPNTTFNLILSWVGLALGWGVRRFHNNIYMFSSPTELGQSQTP